MAALEALVRSASSDQSAAAHAAADGDGSPDSAAALRGVLQELHGVRGALAGKADGKDIKGLWDALAELRVMVRAWTERANGSEIGAGQQHGSLCELPFLCMREFVFVCVEGEAFPR